VADTAPKLDLARLVGDHHEVLYRYAFRLTGSVPDAEDLTQQTFLVAQQKLQQVREAESVRGWLFTVLRNGYLKSFRKQVPLSAASVDLDIESVPAQMVDRPIDSDELQRALGQLPEEFKLVVMMFYFEQRSYREIAEGLSVPLGTVMSRLSRAKACLRRLLDPPQRSPAVGSEMSGQTENRIQSESFSEKSTEKVVPIEKVAAAEKLVSPPKRPLAAR
jgi:RNA polymerase sigma-70 factor (ECF subfamily)